MADVVGYTKLMEADEKGTHQRVLALLRELVEPTIVEHRGRHVRSKGDGFLAMFDSPVEAVRCAIVIQQNILRCNLELPRTRWIQYRIGINIGDVIVEPGDVYGEGVNIAARLEQLAEPGTIYISGGVYEQVKHKLVCSYQSLGDRKVKNITEPVPIYQVLPDPTAVSRATRRQRMRLGAVAVAAVAVCMGGGWYLLRLQAGQPSSRSDAATAQAAVATVPPPAAEPKPTRPATEPGSGNAGPGNEASPGNAAQPSAPQSTPPRSPPQLAANVPVAKPPAPESANPAPIAPQMVLVNGGAFRMGSATDRSEQPIHRVTVKSFWMGKYPVTVREWRQCVLARACAYPGAGEDEEAPVSNVSWDDTQQFAAWLSQATGVAYRLPSEAEWEYAARAGTETDYWWGSSLRPQMANCRGCGEPYDVHRPARIGSFPANPFGLHDMLGGVAQWVADCWHKDFHGAPTDGSAWTMPDCRDHVMRGGSWKDDPSDVRVSSRAYYDTGVRYVTHGFRVARSP